MNVSSGYIVRSDDDDLAFRIVAVGPDGVEICGAYRPRRLNDWRFYLSKPVAGLTGLPRPSKAHVASRDDAVRWVDLVAAVFVLAEGAAARAVTA